MTKRITSGSYNFKVNNAPVRVSHNVERLLTEPEKHENAVVLWNTFAVDTSGLDHTPFDPTNPGKRTGFGDNLGPGRSSRAMAMVQIAVFEAINAIVKRAKSYTGLPSVTSPTNMNAAIGQAAHDVLVALYPKQKQNIDEFFADFQKSLVLLPDQPSIGRGYDLGKASAKRILDMRKNDGSEIPEPTWAVYDAAKSANFWPNFTVAGPNFYATSTGKIDEGDNTKGEWSQDPFTQNKTALGAYWNKVKPFLLTNLNEYRSPAFPSFTSQEFTDAYNEAKQLGGDGDVTPTVRTEEQTEIGVFWAYDGMPSLCAPPRLYNYIILHIAKQKNLPPVELARLLAIANAAMADAAIACWDSKYFHRIWRPVTAIRNANVLNNPDIRQDANFTPFGAPVSNTGAGNVHMTPPFPTYPSGHATFGGALFQVLRSFFGTDDIPFTFVSDEYNGVTQDGEGHVRPLKPRHFENLAEAEEENGQSRIYLGIHWAQDKTDGIRMGRQVGNKAFASLYV